MGLIYYGRMADEPIHSSKTSQNYSIVFMYLLYVITYELHIILKIHTYYYYYPSYLLIYYVITNIVGNTKL